MRRVVNFFYYKSHTFSGQSKASDILVEELAKREWGCNVINIHGLDNSKPFPIKSALLLLPGLVWTVMRATKIAMQTSPLIHMNLGQGMNAFIRYAPPLLLLKALNDSCKIAISLHGNLFMSWKGDDLNSRILVRLLKTADLVTVLGEKQRDRLLSLGIDKEQCRVLPNPCEITPIRPERLQEKHAESQEIKILHLSSLMKSKGYTDFLQSIPNTVRQCPKQKLKFVVCGPIVKEADSKESISTLRKELEDTIAQLNELSPEISAEWIPGLSGEAKSELLYDSHIFVFPTKYSVEAQPLVLLEAMAAGACIVTTNIGEIPEALSGAQATLMNNPTTEDIADATAKLILNPEQRAEGALKNRSLVAEKYSSTAYGEFWSNYYGAD